MYTRHTKNVSLQRKVVNSTLRRINKACEQQLLMDESEEKGTNAETWVSGRLTSSTSHFPNPSLNLLFSTQVIKISGETVNGNMRNSARVERVRDAGSWSLSNSVCFNSKILSLQTKMYIILQIDSKDLPYFRSLLLHLSNVSKCLFSV